MARFLQDFWAIHENLSLQKFFFLQFAKINAGKTFRAKIETVFILKKNIFLDKIINAN